VASEVKQQFLGSRSDPIFCPPTAEWVVCPTTTYHPHQNECGARAVLHGVFIAYHPDPHKNMLMPLMHPNLACNTRAWIAHTIMQEQFFLATLQQFYNLPRCSNNDIVLNAPAECFPVIPQTWPLNSMTRTRQPFIQLASPCSESSSVVCLSTPHAKTQNKPSKTQTLTSFNNLNNITSNHPSHLTTAVSTPIDLANLPTPIFTNRQKNTVNISLKPPQMGSLQSLQSPSPNSHANTTHSLLDGLNTPDHAAPPESHCHALSSNHNTTKRRRKSKAKQRRSTKNYCKPTL